MYDIAIVGGGINGCGIARDAAGRGLSVVLIEKNDLASGTSSASTKLIHGGLRYLEQYEFRLVAKSLREREILIRLAPHIIKPMRFVLPHHRSLRPAIFIRAGLLLYDHLGGRHTLPRSRKLDLKTHEVGKPLKPAYSQAFEYSDCWVDDARLVVFNAMDAAARGADIRVRTEMVSAQQADGCWTLTLQKAGVLQQDRIQARVLVNMAGAWVADVAARCGMSQDIPSVRLVRGSHIVVPKLFGHDNAYLFQNADRRVIFVIPYEQDYTLIGTTDVDFQGDPSAIAITPEETSYLCAAANDYFAQAIKPSDVVWSYSGARPLYDDGEIAAQDTTRDYVFNLRSAASEPMSLTLIGGKITTYRQVAEKGMDLLAPSFPGAGPAWTRNAPLPGGDFPVGMRAELARSLGAEYAFLGQATADRLARCYGTLARQFIAGASRIEDLGTHFGADLYEREVQYLIDKEWATTADDILWRRTKLGLKITGPECTNLKRWCQSAGASGREVGTRGDLVRN